MALVRCHMKLGSGKAGKIVVAAGIDPEAVRCIAVVLKLVCRTGHRAWEFAAGWIGNRSTIAGGHILLKPYCHCKSFPQPGYRADQPVYWGIDSMPVVACLVEDRTLHSPGCKCWIASPRACGRSNEQRSRAWRVSQVGYHAYSWSRHRYEQVLGAASQCSRRVPGFVALVR